MPTHFVVDFRAEIELLESKDVLTKFLLDAIKLAEMELLAGPYIWDTGFDDPNPGLTGFVAITTSHFAIHTFVNQGQAYVDLFSCKEFNLDQMAELINVTFRPSEVHHQEVARAPITLAHRDNITPYRPRVQVPRKGRE